MSLWMVFVMYQNIQLTVSAQDVARISAQNLDKAGLNKVDFNTGNFADGKFQRTSFPGFYWRALPLGRGSNEAIMVQQTRDRMNHIRLLQGTNQVYSARVTSVFPFIRITVVASERYPWPLGGLGSGLNPRAEAVAMSSDPAELIRHFDFMELVIKGLMSSITR